jgi:SAM-dependent methyltransferase
MNLREYRQMYEVEDYHWWYATLHDLIVRVVVRERRRAGRGLVILDAGCGTGRLCRLLAKFGDVSGCDLSEEALACCRERGVAAFRADLNSLDLSPERYDVITSIDTLYHQWIADEAPVLAAFHRALRPGGIVVLNLVAFETLRSSHDIAVQTRRRYTRPEVVAMLENAGFTVELATYRLGLLFPPILLIRLLRRLTTAGTPAEEVRSDVTSPPGLLNGLLAWLARLENRIIPRCSIPFGTSVFVVGRKEG